MSAWNGLHNPDRHQELTSYSADAWCDHCRSVCRASAHCRCCLAAEVEARGLLNDQLLSDLSDMAARADKAEQTLMEVRKLCNRRTKYLFIRNDIPISEVIRALDGGDEVNPNN